MRKLLRFFRLVLYSDLIVEVEAKDHLLNENGVLKKQLTDFLKKNTELKEHITDLLGESAVLQKQLADLVNENAEVKKELDAAVNESTEFKKQFASSLLNENVALKNVLAENAVLKEESAHVRQHFKELQEGTKILVTFIHRTHRLHMPFMDGTIRDAVQKAMNRSLGNGR